MKIFHFVRAFVFFQQILLNFICGPMFIKAFAHHMQKMKKKMYKNLGDALVDQWDQHRHKLMICNFFTATWFR